MVINRASLSSRKGVVLETGAAFFTAKGCGVVFGGFGVCVGIQ